MMRTLGRLRGSLTRYGPLERVDMKTGEALCSGNRTHTTQGAASPTSPAPYLPQCATCLSRELIHTAAVIPRRPAVHT